MILPPLAPLESLRDAAWKLEAFVAEVNLRLERLLPGDFADARQREDFSVRLLRHYSSLGLVDESERVGREALYRYRHLLQVLALRQLQREGWNSKAIAGFTARPDADLEDFLNGRDPAQNVLEGGYAAPQAAPSQSVSPDHELESDALTPDVALSSEDKLDQQRPAKKLEIAESVVPERARSAPPAPAPAAPELRKSAALEFLDELRIRTAQGHQAVQRSQSVPAPSPAFRLHDPLPGAQPWQRLEVAPGLELHVAQGYRPARSNADKKRLLEALQTALETLDQPS